MTGPLFKFMAFSLIFAAAGCAAQRLALREPDGAMLAAVQAATSQTEISLSGVEVIGGPGGTAPATDGVVEGVTYTYGRTGTARPCTTRAAAVLESLGFGPADIRSVAWDTRTNQIPGDQTQLQGFNAWATFEGRQGYLIMSFLPNCGYQTYYARYGLELPA
ncbi:MAG: hypothetical protein AAFW76_11345 [Pseudomonadota bacterium]